MKKQLDKNSSEKDQENENNYVQRKHPEK